MKSYLVFFYKNTYCVSISRFEVCIRKEFAIAQRMPNARKRFVFHRFNWKEILQSKYCSSWNIEVLRILSSFLPFWSVHKCKKYQHWRHFAILLFTSCHYIFSFLCVNVANYLMKLLQLKWRKIAIDNHFVDWIKSLKRWRKEIWNMWCLSL